MASAEDVKRRHEPRLLRMRGVVGIAIGRMHGAECILVYVEEENPTLREALPRRLEDVPVEVIVTGRFRPL